MHLERGKLRIAMFLFCALLWMLPAMGYAASCNTQASISSTDRDALAAVGTQLSQAILHQDYETLRAALLPSEAAEWDAIRGAAEQAVPLLDGGQIQLRSLYLLDASSQAAPMDTQFFCSNASGTLTVTISMHMLPPGKYAVVIADSSGAALGGQVGLILALDTSSHPAAWRLAGVTARQGIFDGHDGVWYWSRARNLAANGQPWSAWYSYDAARWLLIPVDYLSSPNMERLTQEQAQIHDAPNNVFPYTVRDGERTWTIKDVRLDASLREPDLGIVYESAGVTDPSAQRTEAIAVMSAFLKAKPDLRKNFHGLWAYAEKDGKSSAIMELPMEKIP